ncbi:hypothetical protein B7463_g7069, partial [Scytalidium lignicola]
MPQPLRLDSNRESEESVRRLVTRACDTCRKKKIRCEPISDLCAQCIKSKTPCHFTPISVLRSRRRLSRDRRVEELEKRLAWMEGQLRLPLEGRKFPGDLESGTDPKAQDIAGFNEYQPTYITSHALGRSLLGSAPPEIEESARVSQTSNITTPSQQSIPSPNVAFLTNSMIVLISGTPRLNFRRNTNSIGKGTPIFQELPSKEKALHLITIFFQGFNAVHPIFDQDTFMSKFDSAYGLDCSDSDPGWWAALNVVLALAYQYWDMPVSDPKEDLEAWGYFQNAFAATNQLMTRHYTLASVQALLGMAMIMIAMPHQRPITLLISSAIKIAHNLGLHRQYQYPVLSAVESAERIRVFWVAYSLDKDISLQTRQPPTQGDEDMDIEPPSENDYGLVQPGEIHHNLFYFRTRLAIIQGQIYRQLLSVKAGKQSVSERATAAKELEMALQTWRGSVPIELFCDFSGPALDGSPSETSRHPVYLQLLYFKTLAVIHESLPIFPWYHEIQSSEVRVHIISALVTYPVEARSAIKLFNVTPQRKLACVWTALHIFITAATTLLIHTISDPSNPLVQADLKLLEPFLNLLGVVARSGVNDKVEEMYQSSMILFEQARMAIEHSDLGAKTHRHMGKGDPGARESVEDFLERMEHIRSGDSTGISLISRDIWQ